MQSLTPIMLLWSEVISYLMRRADELIVDGWVSWGISRELLFSLSPPTFHPAYSRAGFVIKSVMRIDKTLLSYCSMGEKKLSIIALGPYLCASSISELCHRRTVLTTNTKQLSKSYTFIWSVLTKLNIFNIYLLKWGCELTYPVIQF